jgi:Secretion system C-terminal sorting domain
MSTIVYWWKALNHYLTMKRFYYLISSFLMLHSGAQAQFDFNEPEMQTCADGETQVQSYVGWQAYQTLDGTHNGPLDPEHCINLGDLSGMAIITESEIDVTKPVFIHWHGASPIPLQANQLYAINLYNSSNGLDLYSIDYCDDGVCQGYIVKTRVPDDPSDADAEPEVRTYTQEFGPSTMMGLEIAPMCLASEYFSTTNEITDLYFKLLFEPGFGTYQMQGGYLEEIWLAQVIDTQSIIWYQSLPNEYYLWDFNFLVLHDETSFPNLENITYLEVGPYPNVAEVTNVLLSVQPQASLSFQPFTAVRGTLVEGSADQRHTVTLINNGGEFCINSWFELVFGPQHSLIYNAGKMNMAWGSCLRFEPNSTLQVGTNAALHYGEQGMGMLAMQSGSKIVLEPGAKIVMDNALRLFNAEWQTEPEDIHIYLNEGNSLVFGNYASIDNVSDNEQMKLVVHLNGGYVDITHLSEESLRHIEFVYPEQNESMALLAVLGNPAAHSFNFQMHTQQQGKGVIHMIDAMGKIVAEYAVNFTEGFNQLQLDVQALAEGTYTMQLQAGNDQLSTRWIKLND